MVSFLLCVVAPENFDALIISTAGQASADETISGAGPNEKMRFRLL
jgi:hypothetical protein